MHRLNAHRSASRGASASKSAILSRRNLLVSLAPTIGIIGLTDSSMAQPLLMEVSAPMKKMKWERELAANFELSPLQEFFYREVLVATKQMLGPDFEAELTFYSRTGSNLPSGIPGDPARDYSTPLNPTPASTSSPSSSPSPSSCGVFRDGSYLSPYEICPIDPSQKPANPDAVKCCRHYAYAVPPSRFAASKFDRVPTVVLSPRASRLPPEGWKAILLHEMGHAVDFHCFGRRYLLPDNRISTVSDPEIRSALLAIDREIDDPEFRADKFGNLILAYIAASTGARVQMKIAYDTDSLVQRLVPVSTRTIEVAEGAGPGELPELLSRAASENVGFLSHYPHVPIKGSYIRNKPAGDRDNSKGNV